MMFLLEEKTNMLYRVAVARILAVERIDVSPCSSIIIIIGVFSFLRRFTSNTSSCRRRTRGRCAAGTILDNTTDR